MSLGTFEQLKRIADALDNAEYERHNSDREWWATYRAALTGCYAASHTLQAEAAHHDATNAANIAHGERKR